MCLLIRQKTQRNKVKQVYLMSNNLHAKDMIIGYKTFKKDGDQLCTFYKRKFVSKGLIKSDRASKSLTFYEKQEGYIEHGCHFFLTLEDAKRDLASHLMLYGDKRSVIRKIYFKPEDLVAVGCFNRWCDSGVVMQYVLK
jgi:hypothetical protein